MTKILRMNQLVKQLGLSRSSIYRLRAQGDFVPAIRLGVRSVGFSEEAISAWLEKREAETTQK